MTRLLMLVPLSLFLSVLAGCSSPTPEPLTYMIDMNEYKFSPDQLEVKVGQQVTLKLENSGKLAHEIMFGSTVMLEEDKPSGYQTDLFEHANVQPVVTGAMVEGDHMSGHQEHTGFMVLLEESGSEATISFTATEDMVGEWEMGCFEQDGVHYTAGMLGTLSVIR